VLFEVIDVGSTLDNKTVAELLLWSSGLEVSASVPAKAWGTATPFNRLVGEESA
jgi:hypothetical protein